MNPESQSFKVAAVQDAPVFLDKEATIDKACGLIDQIAAAGAKLAVFPEAYVSGYPDWVWSVAAGKKDIYSDLFRRFLDNAVTIPDPTIERLCKAARRASIHVAIGVNERNTEASGASVFNTLLYIGPDGNILGKHRKLIPTGGERLIWSSGGGDTLVSFDTNLGKLGGLICWENFMPLARTVMYQAGVQIYLAPTWDSSPAWRTAMCHIAREGGMFVISCCSAMKISDIPDSYDFKELYGHDREWINEGRSCIVGPDGQYLVKPVKAKQTILYADLDLNEITDQKWLFDVAGHYSRPDVFDFGIRK